MLYYIWPFLLSMGVSLLLTPVCRWLAVKIGVVDQPGLEMRKQHGRVVPYLGGVALCLAFVLSILFFYGINRKMAVVLVGLLMVVALGVLDDVYKLKPWQKLLGQLLVGLFLVVGGIGVDFVNMPFGGVYSFNNWNVDMVLGGWMWHINILSAIITISLSVVLMNSINFLDGMDGLASMVSLVVFVVMFFLCNAMYVSQPDSARMSIAMAGAIMGFLPYNLPKASIFLGDSGSMMLGYVMAVLSILSGSKVATLLLVLGIVILDTMYVIWSRYRHGRKVWQADRSHLHYKLLDRGYSEWTVLGIYFMISLLLGLAALLLSNGWSKALLMLMFFGGCIFFIVRFVDKKIEN